MRFRITQEMVGRFAQLTGDRSSLHMDAAFARRSPFRRRVAHGMLPVMFLGPLVRAASPYSDPRLASLALRFVRPVWPGDELDIVIDDMQEYREGEGSECEFRVRNVRTDETVTTGRFRIVERVAESADEGHAADANVLEGSSSITEPLFESNATFSSLQKGDKSTFEVAIDDDHARAVRELITLGIRESTNTDDRSPRIDRDLLSAASTSAYVGMLMPGRHAVFTELTMTWDDAHDSPRRLRFDGEIVHLSTSTNAAVAAFELRTVEEERTVAEGKLKVNVSDPPQAMISMDEALSDAKDLGLSDKIVLVTGASRGIGETTAKLFAAHGASVVVNYFRGRDDADRIVEEISSAGGAAIALQADVSDFESIGRLISSAESAFGTIDILVNNAAGDYFDRPFAHLAWEDIQRDIDVIVKGAFYCCQAVLPGMVQRAFGRIVNLSTTAVQIPPAGHTSYVIAKSALLGLTRSLAAEYAADGIRVNAVMPSFVETDLTSNVSKFSREGLRRSSPMKRLATPLDVARSIVFLASNWSDYTTGQHLTVAGGMPPLQ